MKKFFTRSLLVSVLLMATSIVYAQKKVFCEDFQSEKLPTGWTTTGTSWKFQNGEALFSTMLEGASDTLITPIVSVAELANNPTVTIDYRLVASNTNKADVLTVLYRTATSEAWTLLATLETSANTMRVYQPLPATVIANVQIAFAVTYQAGKATAIARVAIENQRAEENAPANLKVDNISATTATLRWEPSTSQYWEQNYLKVSTTPLEDLTQKADIYDGPSAQRAYHTLTALQPATEYYVYVRYECEDNDFSPWASASFRTQCVPVSVPYTEDFEGVLSKCYTVINHSRKATVSKTFPHNGEGAFQFISTRGAANLNYLFFPILDVERIQDYQVSFYVASEVASSQYARELTIGVAEDMTEETFTEVRTISLPQGRQYEHVTISLASYMGSGKIVVFRAGHITLENHIVIDDVTIEKAEACPRPMFVTINNVTYNSARISWVEAGNASEWNMVIATKQYSNPADCEADAAKGEFAGSVVTNPYEATNLLPETTYYVYIQSACAEDLWTPVASFTTGKPVTLPYKEGFDRFDPDFYTNTYKAVPEQWVTGSRGLSKHLSHNYDKEDDADQASYISTSNDHTGSAYVPAALVLRGTSKSETGYYWTSYAMMPAMPDDVNKLMLSFWAYSTNGGGTRLIVGVADVQSNEIEQGKQLALGGNVTPIDTLSFAKTAEWEKFNISLDAYKGTGRYITFYGDPGDVSTPGMYIDDISIDYAPTCFAVQNLSAEAISTTSFRATWKETLNATSWNVKVSSTEIDPAIADGDIVKNVTVNTTPEYMATGLNANTTYYVYVTPSCDNLWQGTQVTTIYALTVPYYNDFSSEATGNGKAPMYWTNGNFGKTVTATSTNRPYVYNTAWSAGDPLGHPIPSEVTRPSVRLLADAKSTTATAKASMPYIVLPELVDVDVKDVTLSFWAWSSAATSTRVKDPVTGKQVTVYSTTGYDYELRIGVMTDIADKSTLTEVASVTVIGDTIKQPLYFFVDMSSYEGAGKYIVFYMDNQTTKASDICIDNLAINLSSTPKRITNVQVIDSTIAETSVQLKWHENGDAKSWKIRLFAEKQSDPSEATPIKEFSASDTIFEVTGLTHSTQYFAYVQAVKGTEQGKWSMVCPFWTKTGIWPIPFYEDFNKYPTGGTAKNTLPNYYDLTGSVNYPYVYGTSSSEGGDPEKKYLNGLRFLTGSAAKYSQIIFPKFDKPINTLQLTMDVNCYNSSTSYVHVTYVGVVTDDGQFHKVAEHVLANTKAWEECFVDFSSYTGAEGRIAIRHDYDMTGLKKQTDSYVDNIKIVEIPQCKRITNVDVDPITSNSATILWKQAGEEKAWNLKVSTKPLVSPSDSTANVYDSQVTTTTQVLDNLQPNTTYYVYVQSVRTDKNCVGEWSQELAFTTLCLPATLPYTVNYEGYKSEDIPGCYTLSGNVTDKTAASVGTLSWYTGGKALKIAQVNKENKNYCALPQVECDSINQVQLRMLVMPSACGSVSTEEKYCSRYFYEVGVMTDPNDPATYVSMFVDSVIADGTTCGKDKYYSFQKYSGDDFGGKGKYITIKTLPYKSISSYNGNISEYAGTIYIDDVKIERIVPCAPPTNLKVLEFDNDTVALTWSALDKNSNFRIRIFDRPNANPDVDACVKDVVVKDTTSAVIKDLNGNITYYAFVRKECSDTEFSTWCLYTKWHTDCEDIQALPYIDTFEEYATKAVPNCWSQITDTYTDNSRGQCSGTSTAKVTVSESTGYGRFMDIKYGDEGCSKKGAAKAITPKLNISSFKDVVLYFDARTSSSRSNVELLIEAVESPALDANAIAITTIKNISQDWLTYYFDLADYYESAQPYQYLRFTPSIGSVFMDNIHITTNRMEVIPVQKLALVSVQDTSATFSFEDATPRVKQWVVEYGPKGFTLGQGTTQIVDTTVITLSKLSLNTAYHVYVRANVEEATSYTGPLAFTTSKKAATLPYYYGFEDANENANLWSIVKTNASGKEYINSFAFGDAAQVDGTGKTSLYVQHGGTVGYHITGDALDHSYSYAVRYINIPTAGTYTIGMRARNYGNMDPESDRSSQDFFVLSLAPASVNPVGQQLQRADGTSGSPTTTREDYNEFNVIPKLYRESDYKNFASNVVISTPGFYQLLLYWQNYSFGVPGPAPAIDSVWVEAYECTEPSAHTFTAISDTSATLSWFAGTNDKFEVVVSRYTKSPRPNELEEADIVAHEIFEGEPTYTVTSLKPHTSYAIYQRTICSDHATEWHEVDFTTNCVTQTLPYTELFAETPECWILSSGARAATVKYRTQAMEDAGEEAEEWNCLSMSQNSYIVLPDFGVPANRLAVELNVFNNGNNSKAVYEVGAVTSPYDMESYKSLQTIKTTKTFGSTSSAGNPYEVENYIAMLHRYTGTGHHIVIKTAPTTGGNIKDLTVTLLPECVAPQLVEVTKIAETTAQLNWIAGNETEWSVALNTDTFMVYENPYLLTNLKNGTDYTVSLRAHCDATHASEWTAPVRFTTKCGANSLPMIENFEGIASSVDFDNVMFSPNCWSQKYTAITLDSLIRKPNAKAFTDVDSRTNAGMKWIVPYQSVFDRHYDGVPHLNSVVWLDHNAFDYRNNYKWIFSPKYEIEENTTLSFDLAISTLMRRTMHVTAKDTSYVEMGNLNVAVTKDGVHFTKVVSINLNEYDSIFRPVQVDLSTFAGDTMMFVLNHGMEYDYYALNFPSIRINNMRMNCASKYALADNTCEGYDYLRNGFIIPKSDLASANMSKTFTRFATVDDADNECDSIITLTLTTLPSIKDTIYRTICEGESFLFDGRELTEPSPEGKFFVATLQSSIGCDSTVYLQLTVNPRKRTQLPDVTIKHGESYSDADGHFVGITEQGIYRDTLVSAQGCDSIIELRLFVTQPHSAVVDTTVCENNLPFTWHDIAIVEAGIYPYTIVGTEYDSVVSLNVKVNAVSQKTITEYICQGDSVLFDGKYRYTENTYTQTLVNALGCDSIVTLNLFVTKLDTVKLDTVVLTTALPFVFEGKELLDKDTPVGVYDRELVVAPTTEDACKVVYKFHIEVKMPQAVTDIEVGSLELYPSLINAGQSVNLVLSDRQTSNGVTVEVCDMLGKRIATYYPSTTHIVLDDFRAAGMYVVRVTSETDVIGVGRVLVK